MSQDRGSDKLMITNLALEDSTRDGLVEAFTQLLGSPVYVPCMYVCPYRPYHIKGRRVPSPHPGLRLLIPEPGETDFLAPDAALRKLLPTVGMCNSLVSE